MSRPVRPLVLVALLALAPSCGPTNLKGDQPDGGGTVPDGGTLPDGTVARDAATPPDGWRPLEDASVRPDNCAAEVCPQPVDDGCGSAEVCGNGLDDDCNGEVDEGCGCEPGAVQACFLGPPGRRNVGLCQDGTQRCVGASEFGTWGPCEGGIRPVPEACDTQDNDCNGCKDDDPSCCEAAIQCPAPGDLPEATPFADYVVNGALFYPGTAQSWSWTIVGGPCDQLLQSTSGKVSYTVAGADTSAVTFHPTLSGDYTFTMTVVTGSGETLSCTFLVHVKGPGFRTELCWDTTGQSDIDLHVHRPGTTTPWFTNSLTGDTDDVNDDDCFYINCTGSSFWPTVSGPAWGYDWSPLAECKDAPGSYFWNLLGKCHNPRLDIDNIMTAGKPENINVDNPNEGDTFRVMVHYFGSTAPTPPETHPMVNVYCGGTIVATYGAAPDVVPSFNTPGQFAGGQMWRVVDVTTHVSGGVTTGCDLTPLHPAGQTTGYWVTSDDRSF